MNRTASIRIKGPNLNYLKNNLTFVLLLLLMIVSVIAGTIVFSRSQAVRLYTDGLFDDYIALRHDKTFFVGFLNSLKSVLPLTVICFMCGTSVIGAVISPVCVSAAAFIYGCMASDLYSTYGLSGIIFNLFVLLPPSLILLFCVLLSAKECVDFSRQIAAACIREARPRNLYDDFRGFCMRHLILIVPIIFSALADIALYNLFEKYFEF